MTTTSHADDRAAIAALVDAFFAAFVSGPDAARSAARLRELLLPEAVIVATCGRPPTVYTVDSFITPRAELLASGRLRDFREWPVASRVELFGDIAHVWCWYDKSWTEADESHHEHGMKTLQLVRTADGWVISALAWDDERPGLTVQWEGHPA